MRFARGLVMGYESKKGSRDDSKDFGVSAWVNGGAIYWDRKPWGGEYWPPGRRLKSLGLNMLNLRYLLDIQEKEQLALDIGSGCLGDTGDQPRHLVVLDI